MSKFIMPKDFLEKNRWKFEHVVTTWLETRYQHLWLLTMVSCI
jgi:hypothetical protein